MVAIRPPQGVGGGYIGVGGGARPRCSSHRSNPPNRSAAPEQPPRHEAGGRAAQQERARATPREVLHVVDHAIDTALVEPVGNLSYLTSGPAHVVGHVAGLVDTARGQCVRLIAHAADGLSHLVGLRAALIAQLVLGLVHQAVGLRRDFVLDLASLVLRRIRYLRRL